MLTDYILSPFSPANEWAACSVVVKLLDLDPQGQWFNPWPGHDEICTAVGPLSKALNPTILQGECLRLSLINGKSLWIKVSAKCNVMLLLQLKLHLCLSTLLLIRSQQLMKHGFFSLFLDHSRVSDYKSPAVHNIVCFTRCGGTKELREKTQFHQRCGCYRSYSRHITDSVHPKAPESQTLRIRAASSPTHSFKNQQTSRRLWHPFSIKVITTFLFTFAFALSPGLCIHTESYSSQHDSYLNDHLYGFFFSSVSLRPIRCCHRWCSDTSAVA